MDLPYIVMDFNVSFGLVMIEQIVLKILHKRASVICNGLVIWNSNSKFLIVLKILHQMGSAWLEMNSIGTWLIEVYFG